MSTDWIRIFILLKIIYRFYMIVIKIPMAFSEKYKNDS